MIATLRRVVVEQKHWLDPDLFNNGVALSQVIPGSTVMQCAAFVGFKKRGLPGAAVSFLGFGLPAFTLMMGFAALYSISRSIPAVGEIFKGLQVIIVAIVMHATLTFGISTLKTWRKVLIAAFAAALFGLNVNPIVVICLAGINGIVLLRNDHQHEQARTKPAPKTALKSLAVIFSIAALGLLCLFFLDKALFSLSVLFMRIDLTAFGGGLASVPLMLHEIVNVHHWLDVNTFMDGILLGQITPGPVVITATFIGYLLHGPLGGVIATLSMFLPSFLLVILVSPFFDRLRSYPYFNRAVGGILCSFVGLLFTVIFRFGANIQWDIRSVLLGISALVLLLVKVDVLWVVLAGILVTIFITVL